MRDAPMIGDVRDLLLDIEDENAGLESELASPSVTRLTEYAIARESDDPTLRSLGRIAEHLHLGIIDMTGDESILPRRQ